MKRQFKSMMFLVMVIALTSILSACGGSTGTTSSGSGGVVVVPGTLTFSQSSMSVTNGSMANVTLTLSGSSNVVGLSVAVTSSDTSIATVAPAVCTFSSPPGAPQTCNITVVGRANGSANLVATAAGYSVAPVAVTVSSSSVPGTLSFSPSVESVTVGSSNSITLTLNGSSGISNLVVNLSSSNPAIASLESSSCTLSSGIFTCPVNINGESAGSVTIIAKASGYTTATASINVVNSSVPGYIAFGTTAVVVSVPTSTQVVLSLESSSGISNQLVNLSSSNPAIATESPSSCNLSSTIGNRSCIVTINALESGVVTINAISESYTIAPVNVTVLPQTAYSRVFTFKNKCAESVWVGSTGGATTSLNANGSSTGSTSCAPTIPGAICPSGSTCKNAGNAGFICYFDTLNAIDNHYKILPGESLSLGVPLASYDPANGYVWSGNIFGREQCNESTGVCVVANCTTESGGTNMSCTTAAAPPVTLAEITMLGNQPDSYDISIINGFNTSMEFGSNNATYSPTQTPYNCGTAGSLESATSNGFTVTASSWVFNPTNLAPGVTASNFNWVSGDGTSATCTNDTSCSPGQVCGYTTNAVFALGGATPVANYALTCGTRLGYWSAAQIWFYNESANNAAPFNFNTIQPGSSYTNGTIFKCATPPFQSGYNPQGAESGDICGCTNWDGIANGSGTCQASSPYWTNEVLPNINWMKQGCPSCYTYPYDDKTTSYTCDNVTPGTTESNSTNYTVTFCPNNG